MLIKNSFIKKIFIGAAMMGVLTMSIAAASTVPVATKAKGAVPTVTSTVTTHTSTSEVQPTKRTMNVSAQGTITAVPDLAYVSVGVLTENKDAKLAQQENATKMDAVIKKIIEANVEEKDIKTANYNMYPKYDYNEKTGVSSIVGYTVSNTVQITVRDISNTGNIIDIATDHGSNTMSGVSFGVSDPTKYYNEALKVAVLNAKAKASTIAEALGITVEVPIAVSESGGYIPTRFYNDGYMAKASMEAASTPIQAGDIEISASVSMTYEY